MLHLHPSLTERRILSAAHKDNGTGFCIACGKKSRNYVESDAFACTCDYPRCAKATVYGAMQLLEIGAFDATV